jgi:hypothetical protein
MSITDDSEEKLVSVQLTESELRYLVAAGYGLLQNIPAKSLPTYTNYTSDEIKRFSTKIRTIMDENDISV